MLLFANNEFTIEWSSVWNERCCKLNDSLSVIKEMIQVRDECKESKSKKEVEVFIEALCIDWLFFNI